MSRRSREKRVTFRGACEPGDNNEIDRVFVELNEANGHIGDGAVASRSKPTEDDQGLSVDTCNT